MQCLDRLLQIFADLSNKPEAVGLLIPGFSPECRSLLKNSMSADGLPCSDLSMTRQYYTKFPAVGLDIIYVTRPGHSNLRLTACEARINKNIAYQRDVGWLNDGRMLNGPEHYLHLRLMVWQPLMN